MNKTEKVYDLEERTAIFAEKVIKLCKTIKNNLIISPIISQLVRSATSIGANYCEANGASSKRDFANKIHICKKESKETMYWLRILGTTDDASKEECKKLWKEVHELALIFGKIASSSKFKDLEIKN